MKLNRLEIQTSRYNTKQQQNHRDKQFPTLVRGNTHLFATILNLKILFVFTFE